MHTLFVLDERERLQFVNTTVRPEEHPAPLVYIGRTGEGTVCHCRRDVPAGLCRELEEVASGGVDDPLAADPALVESVQRRLEREGWAIGRAYSGPAYVFPRKIEPSEIESAEWLLVHNANARVLERYFGEMILEVNAAQPFVAAIVEGNAVAVCRTVRRSSRGAEAGLETAPEYRRRGFGVRAASIWAAEARRAGYAPMYSTWWGNAASRGVAARLGLVQYGVDFHWSEAANGQRKALTQSSQR